MVQAQVHNWLTPEFSEMPIVAAMGFSFFPHPIIIALIPPSSSSQDLTCSI